MAHEIDLSDRTVCIIGLGYVGLTLAVIMAECGFYVLGIERRGDIVASLREGAAHFYEPDLQQKISRLVSHNKITFHSEIPNRCPADIYVVTVGTPLDDTGKVSLQSVEDAIKHIAIKARDGLLLIMRSTVKLGTTRKVVAPILERHGLTYDLAYCPERTIEGHALKELRYLPQIVGGLTLPATRRAAKLFQQITPTVVTVTDPETAEMIKMVDNAHRDVTFAYSNEIARICDTIGISGIEVIEMGKLAYPRTNLPTPGPVGGPCLSKDPHILAEGVLEFGIEPEITKAARRVNERQGIEIIETCVHILQNHLHVKEVRKIALLGLAFKGKPATNDLRGSPATQILSILKAVYPEAEYIGYDAMVETKDISKLGLTPTDNLEETFDRAELVLILNNHQCFEYMDIIHMASLMSRPGLIYDLWNLFNAQNLMLPDHIIYTGLGKLARSGITRKEA